MGCAVSRAINHARAWYAMPDCAVLRSVSSMDDVIRCYEYASCGHFFSRDTMRFFGSRVGSSIYAVGPSSFLFVSSEWTGLDREHRAYSVRRISFAATIREGDGRKVLTANIDTLEHFGAFATRSAAHAYARRIQRTQLEL